MDDFNQANRDETLKGHIVLSVEPSDASHQHDSVEANPELKARLDELHLHKINLADEILVINVGGYVGNSTAREIAHAAFHCKPVRWWSNPLGVLRRLPLDNASAVRIAKALQVKGLLL